MIFRLSAIACLLAALTAPARADLNQGCRVLLSALSHKVSPALQAKIESLKPKDALTVAARLRADLSPDQITALRQDIENKSQLEVWKTDDPRTLVIEGRMKSVLRLLKHNAIVSAEPGVNLSTEGSRPADFGKVRALIDQWRPEASALPGFLSLGSRFIPGEGFVLLVKVADPASAARIPGAYGGVPVATETPADEAAAPYPKYEN